MQLTEDQVSVEDKSMYEHNYSGTKHYVCGAGSSLINIVITFPINKIMFRQQLYGFRTGRAFQQITREGVLNLYRGLFPPLVQKSTSVSLMFGLFNYSYEVSFESWKFSSFTSTLAASMLAGTCEASLTPFERIQTLLLDPKHHNTFRNTYHAFYMIYQNYGLKEYFRGFSAILLRNGPSNVIFFGLRDPIKQYLPKAEKNTFQNTINDFISGAMIGAMCSTIFYPVNVVKARMQSRLGGQFQSFPNTFKTVFKERQQNWRKMYRGIHVNFARSLLSWGIINASYEILMEFFYKNKR